MSDTHRYWAQGYPVYLILSWLSRQVSTTGKTKGASEDGCFRNPGNAVSLSGEGLALKRPVSVKVV
jgi:hypothetical protein